MRTTSLTVRRNGAGYGVFLVIERPDEPTRVRLLEPTDTRAEAVAALERLLRAAA